MLVLNANIRVLTSYVESPKLPNYNLRTPTYISFLPGKGKHTTDLSAFISLLDLLIFFILY